MSYQDIVENITTLGIRVTNSLQKIVFSHVGVITIVITLHVTSNIISLSIICMQHFDWSVED